VSGANICTQIRNAYRTFAARICVELCLIDNGNKLKQRVEAFRRGALAVCHM